MTHVTITTATALTAKQKQSLVDALHKKFGQNLDIEEVVTPALIAGIKIRVGSREYDGSVKSKLSQLHQQLIEQL